MNGLGYDLYRLDLVLRSHEPVGALSLEFVSRQVKRLREFAYVAASNEAEDIVVDGVRYVKSQFAKSPTDARSSSTSGGDHILSGMSLVSAFSINVQ